MAKNIKNAIGTNFYEHCLAGGALCLARFLAEVFIMNKKILLVDDDPKLCALLTDYLTRFGYNVVAHTTPSAGLEALANTVFAAAIFDVMLPEMDGFLLCKKVRAANPQLPIIMLTARSDLTDRVVGLEIGADDYLSKPFAPRELSARLTSVLRRASPIIADSLYFDGLEINLPARRAWLRKEDKTSEEVILSFAEFRVLAELINERPSVIGRDLLSERIRGFERDVCDRSIDIAVSRLRTKLGESPGQPKFIQTLRGKGYAFIARQK